MYRKLTAEASLSSVREAAAKCILAGDYPTRKALRKHGARGDWASISRSFRSLVETKEIILLPGMANARGKVHHVAIGSIAPPLVRIPKPADPNPSPCAAELRDYRAAWRRICTPSKREATHGDDILRSKTPGL